MPVTVKLDECDCEYPGRRHFMGERDCILCECPNCRANATRSLLDLLECCGVIISPGPQGNQNEQDKSR